MDDNKENKVVETEDNQNQDQNQQNENIVETIIQNGVSKEELAEMLKDILGNNDPNADAAAIEAAEKEYFSSHLKY